MLVRLIILGLIVWFASRVVRKLLAGAGANPSGAPTPGGSVDDMVQDPVCGTYVPVRDAFQREMGGRVHHFCSERCADLFDGRPAHGGS